MMIDLIIQIDIKTTVIRPCSTILTRFYKGEEMRQ